VKRQIKKLIYKLDFLKNIKIFFFSIIYFEAAEDNFYNQFNPPPAFIIMDKKQTHLIDHILKKEKYRKRDNFTFLDHILRPSHLSFYYRLEFITAQLFTQYLF
jgi:hypothetical protein